MVQEKGQHLSAKLHVDLETVAREDRSRNPVALVQERGPSDRFPLFGVVDVRSNTRDFRLQSGLHQEAHVDSTRVVTVDQNHSIEIIVEECLVEDSKRVHVLDFLDCEDIGLAIEYGLSGVVALQVAG